MFGIQESLFCHFFCPTNNYVIFFSFQISSIMFLEANNTLNLKIYKNRFLEHCIVYLSAPNSSISKGNRVIINIYERDY